MNYPSKTSALRSTSNRFLAITALTAAVMTNVAFAQTDTKDGIVEMRKEIETQARDSSMDLRNVSGEAAEKFDKRINALIEHENGLIECRASVFASAPDADKMKDSLVDCHVQRALGNARELEALQVHTSEFAGELERVVGRFDQLMTVTRQSIGEKERTIAKLDASRREHLKKAVKVARWLAENDGEIKPERLIEMRSVRSLIVFRGTEIETLKRRVANQEKGFEAYARAREELRLEALQGRQLSDEFGQEATLQVHYADEIAETKTINSALEETRGLFELSDKLFSNFDIAISVLESGDQPPLIEVQAAPIGAGVADKTTASSLRTYFEAILAESSEEETG